MKKQFAVATLICTTLILGACGSNNDLDLDLESDDIADLMQDNETARDMIAESYGVDSLPSWAKKLGLDEAKGLTINPVYSLATSEKKEGYNSVTLSYTGDYDTAMKEAERIAKKANIPVSPEFQAALDMTASLGDMGVEMDPAALEELNANNMGIVYTNYSMVNFDAAENDQYQISITVTPDGALEINAVDYARMTDQATAEGYIDFSGFEDYSN